MQQEYQKELVEFLVCNNVLQFGEFTLKSGRKSPYFYNARNLATGEGIAEISEVYADKIEEDIGLEKFDLLYGPAYAGIPLVAATAATLNNKYGASKRFVYDRKEEKNYGDAKGKLLVGEVREGDRVLIIDDMITTGGTKLEAKQKLETIQPKLSFLGIVIVFDRKEVDQDGVYSCKALAEKGLPVFSVLNAPEVFDYLHNKEINGKVVVTDEIYSAFQKYQEQYGAKE